MSIRLLLSKFKEYILSSGIETCGKLLLFNPLLITAFSSILCQLLNMDISFS